jgi:hypothetical protein
MRESRPLTTRVMASPTPNLGRTPIKNFATESAPRTGRLAGGGNASATVSPQNGVAGQEFDDAIDIAIVDSSRKPVEQLAMRFVIGRETLPARVEALPAR